MFNSWSIRNLLQLWSMATIAAILVIAGVALYSNMSFTNTQNELTSHVLPMENASRQVSSVAASFITRQKQVIAADSLKNITELTPRSYLEDEFEKYLTQLRVAVSNNEQGVAVVMSLQDYYQRFLAVDTQLFILTEQQHAIKTHLQQKIAVIELLDAKIHERVEEISGKINLQVSRGKRAIRLSLKQGDPAYSESLIENILFTKKDIIQKLSQSVRLNVLKITVLTQQIIQSKNVDQLLSIRENDIKQHDVALNIDIKRLKKELHQDDELLKLTDELDGDIQLLIRTILIGESSIYQLRLQQLENENFLALGQQESIITLKVMMSRLEQLSALISEQSLTTVTNSAIVAERAKWIIILLGAMMVLGMLRFIIAISWRINSPLAELRSAMRALSVKNFATRLNVTSGKSEFAILAKDFNSFAENTQKLIQDLAEARDSLQIRKQHITAILNSVPEAILTVTAAGVIESTNPAADRVLKADKNTLVGLNILQFFGENQHIEKLTDVLILQQYSKEFKGLYYNKEPFYMWVSLSPVSSIENNIWVCVISDVTSWKETEANLKTKSSELDAILENAMVGIAFIKDRTFLHVNHKFETLFSCERAQISGLSTRCLYLSDIAFEQLSDEVDAVLNSGEDFEGQLEMVRQNGERFWCSVSSKAIDHDDSQQGTIWLFEDVTQQRKNEERLVSLASFDSLTGLHNRAVFLDRLEHALHKAHRESGTLAVFFLDLDHFKHINDSLGHRAGDQLLCEVATRLQSSIREGDTVARLGGDEFTVILEDVRSAQYVAKIAEKILLAISEVYLLDSIQVNISSSIGISLFPADGRDMSILLRNADAAMYHAKDHGRNNFQFYSAEMNDKAAERLAMETSLRRAVDLDELYLNFQPQIDLRTGKITGAEALLRWNSEQWGNVSPAKFVPILEDTGLIGIVGEMVLTRACEAYMALKDKLVPDFQIAVNLSGRQFKGGQLVSYIRQLLSETGMSPKNLELEITESILMDNTDLAITTLNELSTMGMTLAIDDFGTGYSSLSYLKQFPLNVLKIDRSFVRDVNDDENDAAIVDAIIAMSHPLQLNVVAEGVETKEQLAFLQAHDCERVQGYYFSKPLGFSAFSQFIEQDVQGL
jgi:diguanylate cyclase (GGDEF)-like protein/PAS domain S-box-containing protein